MMAVGLRGWLVKYRSIDRFARLAALAAVLAVALGISAPSLAAGWHGGGWHGGGWHGGGGWRVGIYGGGFYAPYGGYPYDWDYPYGAAYPYAAPYPYAYPTPAPAPVYAAPPAAAPPAPAPAASSSVWYYCPPTKSYYPYVSTCKVAWKQVPTTPPR
jgi:hypothetical protein